MDEFLKLLVDQPTSEQVQAVADFFTVTFTTDRDLNARCLNSHELTKWIIAHKQAINAWAQEKRR